MRSMGTKKGKHQYYKGFPGELRGYFEQDERGLFGHAYHFLRGFGCWTIVLVIGGAALMCLYLFLEERKPGYLLQAVFLGVVFLWFGKALWSAWFEADLEPRMLPYFKKIPGVERLGDIDTFLHGYAIARNCRALDTIAAELNLPELSDFGFQDDFYDHKGGPTWHPPEEGLRTVAGLLEALRQEGAWKDWLDQPEEVIADLQRVEAALEKARDKGVLFCFVLRITHSTNAQEHERRLGTFF